MALQLWAHSRDCLVGRYTSMKAGRSLAESISAEPMQRLTGAGIWLRHCRSSAEPCRSSMRAAKTLLHKCSWTGAQISYSKERNLVQNNFLYPGNRQKTRPFEPLELLLLARAVYCSATIASRLYTYNPCLLLRRYETRTWC